MVAQGTVECRALTVNMRIRKTKMNIFGKRSNVMKVAVDVSRQTSFSHTYRDPKKGLAKRRHQIRDRKTKARARIKCPPISDSDHEWLDNAAFDVMDEDIFESVRMRRGYGRKPFVGGNDVNVDIPAPGPTRCEALQAALTDRKSVV